MSPVTWVTWRQSVPRRLQSCRLVQPTDSPTRLEPAPGAAAEGHRRAGAAEDACGTARRRQEPLKQAAAVRWVEELIWTMKFENTLEADAKCSIEAAALHCQHRI